MNDDYTPSDPTKFVDELYEYMRYYKNKVDKLEYDIEDYQREIKALKKQLKELEFVKFYEKKLK